MNNQTKKCYRDFLLWFIKGPQNINFGKRYVNVLITLAYYELENKLLKHFYQMLLKALTQTQLFEWNIRNLLNVG